MSSLNTGIINVLYTLKIVTFYPKRSTRPQKTVQHEGLTMARQFLHSEKEWMDVSASANVIFWQKLAHLNSAIEKMKVSAKL